MQEESIEKAIEIILTNLDKSNIEKLDKTELMLNINYFLTHYEEETKVKVKKKCMKKK